VFRGRSRYGGPQRSSDEPGFKVRILFSIDHNPAKHGGTRMNHVLRRARVVVGQDTTDDASSIVVTIPCSSC